MTDQEFFLRFEPYLAQIASAYPNPTTFSLPDSGISASHFRQSLRRAALLCLNSPGWPTEINRSNLSLSYNNHCWTSPTSTTVHIGPRKARKFLPVQALPTTLPDSSTPSFSAFNLPLLEAICLIKDTTSFLPSPILCHDLTPTQLESLQSRFLNLGFSHTDAQSYFIL